MDHRGAFDNAQSKASCHPVNDVSLSLDLIRRYWGGYRENKGYRYPAPVIRIILLPGSLRRGLPAEIFLMGLLDCRDLLDFYLVHLVINEVKNGEGSADMQAVDYRRFRKHQFFLVPSGKRVVLKVEYLFDNDAPGFPGEPLQIIPRSPLE
ncbi:MAG: hypothetical protein WC382_12330 [Methanoregulaceae archaeon]